jgi:hypothetical protein
MALEGAAENNQAVQSRNLGVEAGFSEHDE